MDVSRGAETLGRTIKNLKGLQTAKSAKPKVGDTGRKDIFMQTTGANLMFQKVIANECAIPPLKNN